MGPMRTWPVSASQTQIVLSEHETICWPFGEKTPGNPSLGLVQVSSLANGTYCNNLTRLGIPVAEGGLS
jgi:hypothetical protein